MKFQIGDMVREGTHVGTVTDVGTVLGCEHRRVVGRAMTHLSWPCHRLTDHAPTTNRSDPGSRTTQNTAELHKHSCPRHDSNLRHRL
jgi:hypothetical protein